MTNVSPGSNAGLGQKEPSLLSGGATALGTLIVNGIISYGIPISPDLKVLLVSLIGILAPALVGVVVRSHVFSPAAVAALPKPAATTDRSDQGAPAVQLPRLELGVQGASHRRRDRARC